MQNWFVEKFSLHYEQEDVASVVSTIDSGTVFKGTNLWVLIFAIFVASLGLNVNSTAVIIGAMLISPLMGPIMGIGLGMGINDVVLVRKSAYNHLIASLVALITSTVFFSLSPLNEAHSEFLARTAPTIYDVLIALFGGFAGIVATSSKLKGNVIPGVAIATALMPPLCTAGYGLATFQLNFFFGAFYLYIINTVFIALATFLIVRLLKFPYKHLQDANAERIARRVVWGVVVVTALPSVYFGYDVVQQDRFTRNATEFITNEAHFPNDYLLSKNIDAKEKSILLVFGGAALTSAQTDLLKSKLNRYNLSNAVLDIKQGFSYLSESHGNGKNEELQQLTNALDTTEKQALKLRAQLDSIYRQQLLGIRVFDELKTLHPGIRSGILQPTQVLGDSSGGRPVFLVILDSRTTIPSREKAKIKDWLKIRLQQNSIKIIYR